MALVRHLRQGKLRLWELRNQYDYGYIRAIDVVRPSNRVDWVVVRTSLTIPCGTDDSLYVFHATKTGASLLLAAETAAYDDTRHSQNDLRFAIANKSEGVVALMHTGARCKSSWRNLRYAVMRPSQDADRPAVLLAENARAHIATPPQLFLADTTVRIKFNGMTDRWRARRRRPHLRSYRVGREVTRIAPFASLPADAVAEWLSLDEQHARTMTVKKGRNKVMRWHATLQGVRRVRRDAILRPLTIGKDRWDVGIACWGCSPALAYYVTVARVGKRFVIKRIRIGGPDAMNLIVHGHATLPQK